MDLKEERRKAVLVKRDVMDDAVNNKGGVFEEKDLTKIFEASTYLNMDRLDSFEDFKAKALKFAGGAEKLQKWAGKDSGIQRIVLTSLQLGSEIEKQTKEDLIDMVYQREMRNLYNM